MDGEGEVIGSGLYIRSVSETSVVEPVRELTEEVVVVVVFDRDEDGFHLVSALSKQVRQKWRSLVS